VSKRTRLETSLFYQISVKYKENKSKKHSQPWKEEIKFKKKTLEEVQDKQGETSGEEGIISFMSV
jgi:hypothetical protein